MTVNYNGGAFLGDFLLSFRALTYPNLGLVIVDNASTDGSIEQVPRLAPTATLLRSAENTGFCGGYNLAARTALEGGAAYVLYVNNDTRLDPGLIEALLAEADARTMVAPRVYLEGAPGLLDDTAGEFSWLRGAWRNWTYGKPPPPSLRRPGPVQMASLCCLLVPATVLRRVGLLDERLFMYYEDFDFVRRAQDAGFRLRQTPAARLWHRKSASSGGGETAFRAYYATRNRLALLRRHQPLPLFALFVPYFVAGRAVRALGHLRRGRPAVGLAMGRGIADFFLGRMGRRMLPDR